ncbi:MAG: ABC transporter permease subunit [Clostridiales bacterium]|nr:ABC transporter permease subunit [Clostridiales bacterium]
MRLTEFFQKKSAWICIGFLALLAVAGVFAPFAAPHDPTEADLMQKFLSPSLEFPMGTDHMGRCIFSRIIYGIRPTLGFAVLASSISAVCGIFIGIFSGYIGGITDKFIMRVCDILYAFPSLVLSLVIVSILGTGIRNIVLAMVLVQWVWYARVARNLTRSEKEKTYILASRLSASSIWKIVRSNIFPNIMPQMIAIVTIDFGQMILAISGFSFLGLGVKAPNPEWGMMISDGRVFMHSNPMLMFWPGVMILISNILGDMLRDFLDEKSM